MSNFTEYKDWAIPEGAVKQVTDENGNVIWMQAPKEVTVHLTGNGYAMLLVASIEIDGTVYRDGTGISDIVIPTGTVIKCTAYYSSYGGGHGGTISLNGTVVAAATDHNTPVTYDYVAKKNVNITLKFTMRAQNDRGSGTVEIVEL